MSMTRFLQGNACAKSASAAGKHNRREFEDDGYDSVIDNDGNLDELVRRFLDILPDVQIVVAAGALPYVASTISTAGGRMFGEPYISVDGKTALFRADLPVPLKVFLLQNPNVFEISPVQYFSPS